MGAWKKSIPVKKSIPMKKSIPLKKIIWNTVFLAAVFALTIYGVFHGEDLGAMMDAIREADIRWLIPGLVLVFLFIWGESIILWHMLASFGIRLRKRICFLFSSAGFFFCCITPSASGGQPAQVYFMKKEKIPVPVAAVILMVVTITYKLVLVVIGAGVVCFGRGFMHRYLEEILPIFYLGLLLNVFCVAFMTLLVFCPSLTELILRKGLALLERLRFLRHKEERGRRLGKSMEVYGETALYLKRNAGLIIRGPDHTGDSDHLCAADGPVLRDMDGVPGLRDVRHAPVGCGAFAGGDIRLRGYAAPAGRHGDQRGAVHDYLRTGVRDGAASGHGPVQRDGILRGASGQRGLYHRGPAVLHVPAGAADVRILDFRILAAGANGLEGFCRYKLRTVFALRDMSADRPECMDLREDISGIGEKCEEGFQ